MRVEGINQVAVIGSGMIGACMAVLTTGNGYPTTLLAIDDAQASAGLSLYGERFQDLIKQGLVTEKQAAACRKLLKVTLSYADIADVDFIFECVFEKIEVKHGVNGVATFTDLALTTTGAHTLQFTTTTPALSVNSASFTVTAAAATTIAANSVVTQSAVAGAAVAAPPSVLVTDGTNPVSGVTVTFTVTGGGGAISPVSPASVVTNASGIATLTSWTLGTTAALTV